MAVGLYIYIYDAFRSKESSPVLLVHEQQAYEKRCLSSRHSTACSDYTKNIYENTSNV